jgi:hypothetical protein
MQLSWSLTIRSSRRHLRADDSQHVAESKTLRMHSSLIISRLGVWAVVPRHILKMTADGQNSEVCLFIADKPLSARAGRYHIDLQDIICLTPLTSPIMLTPANSKVPMGNKWSAA